jgi:quercetin dioxygenase-like cupin family protein
MWNVSVRRLLFGGLVALIATIGVVPRLVGQTPTVQRKVLLQQDFQVPGYEVLLIEASLPVGGREGKHSHPGTMVGYILEGTMDLEVEGKPTQILKAGDSAMVEGGKMHEGINRGRVPIKALVTFVVEKGKPLTTPHP